MIKFPGFMFTRDRKLISLSYNHNEDATIKGQFSVNVEDTFKVLEITKHSMKTLFTRKINTTPISLFESEITVQNIHQVQNKYLDSINLEDYDIEKLVDQNASKVFADTLHYISLIFANITSSFGKTPLIMPPVYKKNKLD